MGIKTNASIVTDGLAFNVDLASTRSYAGPPIRNIATQISQSYANNASALFKITNGTETVNIPSLGTLTSKYVDVYNDYAGGSTECCPSLFNYGTDLATNGSTLHTYAIVYKSVNDYTHPNYMYRYEHNGPTYVLEGGVFNTSNRIHLGDDWYWAWGTFTTNAATTRFNSVSLFMYQYLTYNRIYVAKVLLCQGDYSTLHPRYWPELGTTRAATSVTTDLTGKNTISASGLTYGNEKITMPNTNAAWLDVTSSTNFKMGTLDFTINVWLKQLDNGGNIIVDARDGSTLQGYLFGLNYPSTGYITFFINGSAGQSPYYSNLTTLPNGVPQNITAVVKRSTATIDLYVNGALYDTITGINSESISGTGDLYRIGFDRGGGTANMELYAYSHYNRALTAAEVRQNFNALRGRFGI